MPQYKGDIGKFRKALADAGYTFTYSPSIFNDDRKCKPKLPGRRLKLWFATKVFNSPQKQQRKLERGLKEAFGDRIISMYFVENSTPYGRGPNGAAVSLCIKLNT